jgi:hypothetical protein
MKKQYKMMMLAGLITIGLGGCSGSLSVSPSSSNPPSDSSPSYKEGYNDGCSTAHGTYTKESELFNTDKDYYDGWFAGRSACQYE